MNKYVKIALILAIVAFISYVVYKKFKGEKPEDAIKKAEEDAKESVADKSHLGNEIPDIQEKIKKTLNAVTPLDKRNLAPKVGETIYASWTGAKVFNPDFTPYKTANEGEWLGKIYSDGADKGSATASFWIVSGNKFVPKTAVYADK